MGIFKYTAGDYYVDQKFGNDANAGTKEAPFENVAAAEAVAGALETIVIGSGVYAHLSTVNGAFIYRGEGTVIFDGSGLGAGVAIDSAAEEVSGITFINYNAVNNAAIDFNVSAKTQRIIDCFFYECNFENSDGAFEFLRNCDFVDCTFNVGTPVTAGYEIIDHCNFLSCTGTLTLLGNSTYGIRNCIFNDCTALGVGIVGASPNNALFDYNNVDGQVQGLTQAQLEADGANLNGTSSAITNIFNDYSAARTTAEFWKQDTTQKLTSPVLEAGQNKTHIGNDYKAYLLTATDLWNNYLSAQNNMQLSGDVIDLSASPGDLQSTEIDMGELVQLGKYRQRSLQIYNGSGEAIGYIYKTDDPALDNLKNQKATHNMGIHEDPLSGQTLVIREYEPNWGLYEDFKNVTPGAPDTPNPYNIGSQFWQDARYLNLDFNMKDLGSQLRGLDVCYRPTYVTLCLQDVFGHDIADPLTFTMTTTDGQIISSTTTSTSRSWISMQTSQS